MKTAYPRTTNQNGVTFTKTKRSGNYCWGELNNLSDAEIRSELNKYYRGVNFDALASFNNLNPLSCSFDYPAEDALKALLGAFRCGVVFAI